MIRRFVIPALTILAAAAAALAGCSPWERADSRPTQPLYKTDAEIAAALDQPVRLSLPARVLVVEERDGDYMRGMSSYSPLAVAVSDALCHSRDFQPTATIERPAPTQDPQGAQPHPIRQARELAAIERVPYALLCRAGFRHDEGFNPLRILYLPVLTMFFVPGERLETDATVEADLIDVRTGAILCRVAVSAHETSNFIRVGQTRLRRGEHERELSERAAGALAARLDDATRTLLAARTSPAGAGQLPGAPGREVQWTGPAAQDQGARRPGFFEDRP